METGKRQEFALTEAMPDPVTSAVRVIPELSLIVLELLAELNYPTQLHTS